MIESVIAVWSRRNLQNINIDMQFVILLEEIFEEGKVCGKIIFSLNPSRKEGLGKDVGKFPSSLVSGLNFEVNIHSCACC